jgi:hypothetical protein
MACSEERGLMKRERKTSKQDETVREVSMEWKYDEK